MVPRVGCAFTVEATPAEQLAGKAPTNIKAHSTKVVGKRGRTTSQAKPALRAT